MFGFLVAINQARRQGGVSKVPGRKAVLNNWWDTHSVGTAGLVNHTIKQLQPTLDLYYQSIAPMVQMPQWGVGKTRNTE